MRQAGHPPYREKHHPILVGIRANSGRERPTAQADAPSRQEQEMYPRWRFGLVAPRDSPKKRPVPEAQGVGFRSASAASAQARASAASIFGHVDGLLPLHGRHPLVSEHVNVL